MKEKILLIDSTNFINFPTGGTLIFDRQLLKVIPPSDITLVGITTNDIPLGKWTSITIFNQSYKFLPILKVSNSSKRPIIPLRIKSVCALIWYLSKIQNKSQYKVFTQTPQFIFALNRLNWKSICYCFAGVGNSVQLSRYKYLRFLGILYERLLFKKISIDVDLVLAAADNSAIDELVLRSNGLLKRFSIKPFPTRFDESLFKPLDQLNCRQLLGIDLYKHTLVVVGRLSWVKGWDLVISMLRLDLENSFNMIFVGDGEDRATLESSNIDLIQSGRIQVTGFIPQEIVVKYINAADIVLVGSHHEGWSTAMLESLACGKPLVSTNISGASDLIREGENGFILYERSPELFLELVKKTLTLKNARDVSIDIASKYSLKTLYADLLAIWKDH